MALKIKFPNYEEVFIEHLTLSDEQINTVLWIEADNAFLHSIMILFTPIGAIGSPLYASSIPLSNLYSQRWYGDIAKTIIYALLQ